MQYCIKTNFYSCARIFCEIPNIPNVSRNAPASFVSLVIYFPRNLHLNIENQLLRTSSSQIDREVVTNKIWCSVSQYSNEPATQVTNLLSIWSFFLGLIKGILLLRSSTAKKKTNRK